LFGETLPPDIKTILVHIGIWDDFLNDKHLPSTGNRSAWGSEEITENNFIFHPHTYGWHLDRFKFDFMLLEAAKRAGAIHLEVQIETIEKYFNNNGWILNLKNKNNRIRKSINSAFIVDATGRTSWFCYRQGIRRFSFDSLCGYVSFLSTKTEGDSDSMTLIESVSDGWWYSALLPKNIRVTSFFTDSNLPIARSIRTSIEWKNTMMQNTSHIKVIHDKYDYHTISGPYIRIANSSILEKVSGENWLAVGDAAASYDPLSSQGILTAMTDSISASDIIRKYLKGKDRSLEEYNKRIITNFKSYLKRRDYYYNLEKRWSNNAFWKQNQKLFVK
jgi:flavin-dependent dehydrogenase